VLTAPFSPAPRSQVETGVYTSTDAFASDVRRIAANCALLYGHARPDIVADASGLVYRFESMLAAGGAFGITSAVRFGGGGARGFCARTPTRRVSHFFCFNILLFHLFFLAILLFHSVSSILSRELHTTDGKRVRFAGGASNGHSAHTPRWPGAPPGLSRSAGQPRNALHRTASVGGSYSLGAMN
jgi:hypothetical protein